MPMSGLAMMSVFKMAIKGLTIIACGTDNI